MRFGPLIGAVVGLSIGVGCMFDLGDVVDPQASSGDASVDSGATSDGGDAFTSEVGDAPSWPTPDGGCKSEQECGPNQICDENAKCVACVPSWTPEGGGDHCGDDWGPADGALVAGEHVRVGKLLIAQTATVQVKPYDGAAYGSFAVEARAIDIAGSLTAAASGYAGGPPGNGGLPSGDGSNGNEGAGEQPGTAGEGGAGRGSACNKKDTTPHAAGGVGAPGSAGGYVAAGANGDSCTAPRVVMGSAGGGGGGGGGGEKATCCSLSVSGGEGGRGGVGGWGGGAITLVASETLKLSGTILTTGAAGSSGQGGANGASDSKNDPGSGCDACGSCADHRYAYCPGMGPCGSAANDCCQRDCCYIYEGGPGGAGGRGGNGAGGGVLLQAPSVDISGFVNALGGENATDNGGTISILHKGTAPATDNVAGGLLCTTTY